MLEAAELVSSGAIEVRVTEAFPLEQAAQAHRVFERRAAVGKFILTV
jgi:NADPH:quinone reductase-like Zn-dependent oxidoreductase